MLKEICVAGATCCVYRLFIFNPTLAIFFLVFGGFMLYERFEAEVHAFLMGRIRVIMQHVVDDINQDLADELVSDRMILQYKCLFRDLLSSPEIRAVFFEESRRVLTSPEVHHSVLQALKTNLNPFGDREVKEVKESKT